MVLQLFICVKRHANEQSCRMCKICNININKNKLIIKYVICKTNTIASINKQSNVWITRDKNVFPLVYTGHVSDISLNVRLVPFLQNPPTPS